MLEKCPDTELFMVRIFLYSVWNGDLLRPNAGKYGPEITPYLDTFQAVYFGDSHMKNQKQFSFPV